MSAGMAVAVALSLVSAVAYACAAVAQERLAARTRQGTPLLTLLRRGPWWSAVGLNATGALLHVVALTYGPLTVVQPLGALTLVAAVPLGARRAGRQVSRGEWRGTALTLVGLAIILLTAAGASPERTLTLPQALGVAGVAMALVALLTRPGARPGLRHAAASGIISGVASALTQTVTVAATEREGATGALPLWQVGAVALVVAAFASGGLLLSQTAYRGGLGAPLAVLTLANPVAASVIGLALLGEGLQGGELGVAAALVGAVVAARGVVLLTRTAAVTAGTAGPSSTPEPVPAPAVSAPTYRAATLRAERRRRRAGATRSAVSRRAICPVPADPEEAEVTGPVGRVPRQRRLRRCSRAAA
ncbi:DMT family transporter [Streptomyces sp. NPDC101062]|uniref:DMT family transporter n=1 Tax=unclassified Streptomyces TaxID=2593676 RepID=UPI0038000232